MFFWVVSGSEWNQLIITQRFDQDMYALIVFRMCKLRANCSDETTSDFIFDSFQLEIQLEWIGLSWYWVGMSWFILEYWISNWNKILHQLSPIGNSVGLSWFDLSELELVGFCFFPIVNLTSQYISNWKFYFPTNAQLEPILSSWEKVQLSPVRSKMSWKKVQLNPIVSNWFGANSQSLKNSNWKIELEMLVRVDGGSRHLI